jgi:O-antigen ligase
LNQIGSQVRITNNKKINDEVLFIRINSMMVALICSGAFISLVFHTLGFISDGLLPIISMISLLATLTSCFLFKQAKLIKINLDNMMLILFFIVFFSISYLRFNDYQYLNKYLIEFLFYGGIIFLLLIFPISYKLVITYVSSMSLLILLNPISFLENLTSTTSSLTMGSTYAILPVVIASILHFFFFRDKGSLIIKFSYFTSLFLLFLLLFEGIRGVYVAIFLLIIILVFTKFGGFKKIPGIFFGMVSITILFLTIFKLEEILINVYHLFNKVGIEIYAINKTLFKIQTEGILNGREIVYGNTLQMIGNNPFFGNGIGAYALHYNGGYPHNLILHLVVEFGLIFAIPIIRAVLKRLFVLFKPITENEKYNEYKIFIFFCFVASLPKLMFSSYLWKEQIFWVMVFATSSSLLRK